MRHRERGGCLSAVIFIICLALSVALIAVMLSSVKNSEGGTLLSRLLERVGIEVGDHVPSLPFAPSGGQDTSSNKEGEEPKGSGTAGSGGNTAGDAGNSGKDSGETSGIGELPSVETIRVEITQEQLRELLEEAMSDRFPLTLEDLLLSSDSTIMLTGSAERDKFIEVLEQNNAVSRLEIMALRIAPEEIGFRTVVSVSYDASSGQITLAPKELIVANLTLPTAAVPKSLIESLNASLTDFFASYGRKPAGLTVYDGYLSIYFE